jgi:Lon protease-like protein
VNTASRREIALFPLNTVLFPGGLLPLRIFEQRYLEMTKACLRDNAPFGACLIREGREVGTPAVPCSVGCLAAIAEWEMPQLGLFHLLARGGQRFRILRTSTAPSGLIAADIEVLADLPGRSPVDPDCRSVLESIIDKVGADRFPAPLDFENPDWVAYRLAEILPIHLAEKQALLEMSDAAQRFERLRHILGGRNAPSD